MRVIETDAYIDRIRSLAADRKTQPGLREREDYRNVPSTMWSDRSDSMAPSKIKDLWRKKKKKKRKQKYPIHIEERHIPEGML